jgi:hypothetical protein
VIDSVLGARASVGGGASLVDVVVGDDVAVEAGAVLAHCRRPEPD